MYRHLHNLQELRFTIEFYKDDEYTVDARHAASSLAVRGTERLKSITLTDSNVNDADDPAISWACFAGHSGLERLEVSLSAFFLTTAATVLATLPKLKNVTLETTRYTDCDIDGNVEAVVKPEHWCRVIERFLRLPLEQLHLLGALDVVGAPAQAFTEGLISSTIEDLRVCMNSQNEEAYAFICQGIASMTTLRELILDPPQGFRFVPHFPLGMLHRSSPSLSLIQLISDFSLRSEDLNCLAIWLEHESCALKYLELYLFESKIEDVCTLVSAVQKSKLKEFSLTTSPLWHFIEMFLELLAGLCNAPALQSLVLLS